MYELICDGCGKEILDCTNYIELYNGVLFHNNECERKYYDELEWLKWN